MKGESCEHRDRDWRDGSCKPGNAQGSSCHQKLGRGKGRFHPLSEDHGLADTLVSDLISSLHCGRLDLLPEV